MDTDDVAAPVLPSFADVVEAAERLKGLAVHTPLLTNDVLDAAVGGRVFVKAECLQLTGSFKFRGAYNRLSRLTADQRMTGVVAFSSGNHAQGIAASASLVGVEAVVVMPADAPTAKIEGTRRLGAEVVLYDRRTESREAIAAEIAAARGAVVVPAFEDFHIIAGQGTVGLEVAAQLEAAGVKADALLCPVSGGGLLSGISLAVQALSPDTRLFGVEPAAYDDLARSLAAGRAVEFRPDAPTLCDALMAPRVGDMNFAILQPRLAGALGVTDEEAMAAVAFAFRCLKIVLEPSGAAALAALLSGRFDLGGGVAVVIASGGNVDASVFRQALDGLN